MIKNKAVFAVLFSSFFLGCSGSAVNRNKVSVTDVNGIKSRIEAVDKELAGDIKPEKKGEMFSAPAISRVKTVKKTAEVFEFESEGEGESAKYESIVDAEKRAEEDALSKAVRESGVNVYSGFQNVMLESGQSNYEFIGKYINVWSNSLVSYERTGAPACSFDGILNRCVARIKGKAYFKGSPDPAFELKAVMDKPAYFAGDEITLNFRLSKDAYVTVLSCDEDGNVSVIFPNNYAENRLFKAGEEIKIPENMAFRLKAYLPENRSRTTEMLHVIAVKSQPLVPDAMLREKRDGGFITYPLGGIKDMAARLAKFERSDWTSQVIIYEVKSRQ